MNATNLIGLSMMLFGVGGVIIYLLKKAKFKRQNEHGVEVFKDFDEKLMINLRDGAASFVGRLCITLGTFCLMIAIGSITFEKTPLDLLISMVFHQL